MNEVQQEVLKAARREHNKYTLKGLSQNPAFKETGEQYIQFAKDEPKLFQLLFMSERGSILSVDSRLGLEDYYAEIVSSIQTQYGVSERIAKKLYRHLWIYAHGIATLIVANVCVFTDEEISVMLTEAFRGIYRKILSDEREV